MQLKTNALPNKTSGWSYYKYHVKLNCNFWDSNHRFLISWGCTTPWAIENWCAVDFVCSCPIWSYSVSSISNEFHFHSIYDTFQSYNAWDRSNSKIFWWFIFDPNLQLWCTRAYLKTMLVEKRWNCSSVKTSSWISSAQLFTGCPSTIALESRCMLNSSKI